MTPQPFRLALLCQEADRPDAVRDAVTGAALPPGCVIEVVGWPVAALRVHARQIAPSIAAADAIIVSHVLTGLAAEGVERLLERARPNAQVLVINCLWPVMRHLRIGSLRFDGGATLDMLREFVPDLPESDDLTDVFRHLVQVAPQLLDRIPSEAGDVRTLLEAYVRWSNPTALNLRSLAMRLADRYGSSPGAWTAHIDAPECMPACGLYHPVCGITDSTDALPAADAPLGAVGLLLMRGPIVAGNTHAADDMIARIESRGFRVVPAFSESFDFREPVERWLDPSRVCALVSMTGFPLVGGHNGCEPDAVAAFLGSRGIPYLATCALMVQERSAWERSGLGLTPIEVAMQPAVFELEGAIEPIVVHTLAGGASATKEVIADRAERLVDRLTSWRCLQSTPNSEKRILLTLFAFPPGKGAVGTAAYLDVFRSAWNVLRRLRDEGYSVEIPDDPETLLAAIVEGEDKYAPVTSAGLATGERIDLATYERIAPDHARIEKMWGPAPGRLNSDGRDLIVHGVRLGNVFVGVQPSFGFEGDPMRLLFERGATPHHGFLAYYRWAEEVFGAHAVVHLGTHGALEFMPGKQAGLSSACWPDVLAGRLPNIYLYSVNNPSEGTIAKRRGNAVTIGHLTPPADRAGLYRELVTLAGLVDEYREEAAPTRRIQIAETLRELAADVHLDSDMPPWQGTDPDAWIGGISVALAEIEGRRIPIGLHVIGRTPERTEKIEVTAALACGDGEDEGLVPMVLRARGHDPAAVERDARARDPQAVHMVERAEDLVREVAEQIVDGNAEAAQRILENAGVSLNDAEPVLDVTARAAHALDHGDEITPLVDALAGRYIRPGPGGDPARHPGVLPVGRNLHALDPAAVPSPAAWRRGARAVDLLIERHRTRHGAPPRHVGLVLWGLDNIKTHGEGIAQALHLLGVRPRADSIGRMTRVDVVSLEELGRPRVDVTITASGIFRDIFGLHIDLLDRAVRLVADLDEAPADNPIRARVEALVAEGFDHEEAASRVFSNASGAYGTHIDHLVALSRWSERGELADSFARRKGFVFSGGEEGKEARGLLEALARDIDVTVQNLDSSEVSLTDVDHYFEYLGGLTALVEAQSGSQPPAVVLDATSGRLRLRDLEETVRLETRARLLNPRWYEGLLAHGYEGVEEIRKRLDYTFGFSATCDATDGWIYREAHEIFLQDTDIRERMRGANVHAYSQLVTRLAEAGDRGFWDPTGEERALLRQLTDATEDAIEGVASA